MATKPQSTRNDRESPERATRISGKDKLINNSCLELYAMLFEESYENCSNRIIHVSKNDNVNNKVKQLLDSLKSTKAPLLVSSVTPAISKLIALIEILKSKYKEDEPAGAIFQYNKAFVLSDFASRYFQLNKYEADDDLEMLNVALQAIEKESNKVLIMHIILSTSNIDPNVLEDWSIQQT